MPLPSSDPAMTSHTSDRDEHEHEPKLSTLRGAEVAVDARRAGLVAVVVVLATLAVTTVALFVAGAERNARITRLEHQGVTVPMTVGGCRGLLGGSGSNAAGYRCWGTLTVGGHRYSEGIPGSSLLAPGAVLRMVTVPGDPGLLSTPAALAHDRPSARVFVLPAVLSVALVLALVALLARRRRSQPALRSFLGLARGGRLGDVVGGV